MNTINLPMGTEFQMENCEIFFGGVPPMFASSRGRGGDYADLDLMSFLGSMRGLTVSNPGSNSILNPLYAVRSKPNPFYGIEPSCGQKVSKYYTYAW